MPTARRPVKVQGERGHPRTLMGIYRHSNFLIVERKLGTTKAELISLAHILKDAWERIGQLVKERDLEILEERGSNPREKSFQIITLAFIPKPSKIRKGDVGKR